MFNSTYVQYHTGLKDKCLTKIDDRKPSGLPSPIWMLPIKCIIRFCLTNFHITNLVETRDSIKVVTIFDDKTSKSKLADFLSIHSFDEIMELVFIKR